MSFTAEFGRLKLPSKWVTAATFAFAILFSWCAIHFDQARGAAYCTMPVIAFLFWCGEANITYRNTRKLKLVVLVLCMLYWVSSNALLMQVISVEVDDPIVESGLIYKLSVILAAD